MRLTIRAIIRWEQLNRRPYSSLNEGDENDLVSLFYACRLSEGANITLQEFRKSLTYDLLKEMSDDLKRQSLVTSQFQPDSKKKMEESEEPKDSTPVYIGDLVSMLVINGMDAHFALNEMELCDMPLYLRAYENRERRKREFQRDEIFWLLRPHLSKGVRKPGDLYSFPWEIEERKEKAREETEKGMPLFESFMKSAKQKI
jgi:hypothetical protein